MRKIDAIVMIEKAAQMYIMELHRVEQAGLNGIFSMFKEVVDLHEMAKKMSGDTFQFRLEGEVVNTFTRQVEGILYDEEAEERFKNFAINLNAGMAEEMKMQVRISAAVELAELNLKMVHKMVKVGEAGVDMRDLFEDDYIYICIKNLCGFEMVEKYAEYLTNPFMSKTTFFQDLVEMSGHQAE